MSAQKQATRLTSLRYAATIIWNPQIAIRHQVSHRHQPREKPLTGAAAHKKPLQPDCNRNWIKDGKTSSFNLPSFLKGVIKANMIPLKDADPGPTLFTVVLFCRLLSLFLFFILYFRFLRIIIQNTVFMNSTLKQTQMLPAAHLPCRLASSSFCLLSAARAVSFCGLCRRRNTSRLRPCERPGWFPGQ